MCDGKICLCSIHNINSKQATQVLLQFLSLSIDLWPSWSSSETKIRCCCRLFCLLSSCARFENYAKLASLENVQLFEQPSSVLRVDPMISWLRNFKAIGRSKNFDNMMKKHAMACTLCKNWAFQQNLLSPAKNCLPKHWFAFENHHVRVVQKKVMHFSDKSIVTAHLFGSRFGSSRSTRYYLEKKGIFTKFSTITKGLLFVSQ